jgi:hypothetical protein
MMSPMSKVSASRDLLVRDALDIFLAHQRAARARAKNLAFDKHESIGIAMLAVALIQVNMRPKSEGPNQVENDRRAAT